VILCLLLAGKFYAYGLLRTLNARQNLRDRMNSQELGRVSLSDWSWSGAAVSGITKVYLFISTAPQKSYFLKKVAGARSINDKTSAPQSTDTSRRGSEATTSTSTMIVESDCPELVADTNNSSGDILAVTARPPGTPVLDAQERGMSIRRTVSRASKISA
jgi:hypothetical protein